MFVRPASLAAAALAVAAPLVAAPLAAGHVVTVHHASSQIPRPAHTIVIVMENRSYSDIIGNPAAPFLSSLAKEGASFTQSFAIRHPSEPNYLALFSGSTHGVTSDSCPHTFGGRNLGSELRAAHDSFVGYSESLPARGFPGCESGNYARKHSPWVNFSDLPGSINRPLSELPAKFSHLPTLSFIIPNLQHDMHNGTIAEADHWLKQRLGRFIRAARRENGLVVITWDEDDGSHANKIPTIMIGANVRPGRYAEHINDYTVLRTLQAMYGLKPIGHSANRKPIVNIWKRSAAS
jgi:phosphatidylinositol-3-phosphatase